MRVRIIAGDGKIFETIAEDIIGAAQDLKLWESTRGARELFCHQMFVIGIEMAIGAHPDDFIRHKIALLGEHA